MSDPSIVHIIDDEPATLRSLQLLMESASLHTRLYGSAEQFLEENGSDAIGCVLVDLRMPGMGGIELLERMRNDGREIPVIVVSGHSDVPAAVRSMKLGAVDLILKPVEPAMLVAAVHSALRKSMELQRRRAERQAARVHFAALTPREVDLLQLVVAGRSNKQIAAELHIAISTVANHRANLMRKTGSTNGPDLARLSTIAGITSSS